MNKVELKSPRILHLSWGHIEVEGHRPFKDAKVFPGGAREWDGVTPVRATCRVSNLPTFEN